MRTEKGFPCYQFVEEVKPLVPHMDSSLLKEVEMNSFETSNMNPIRPLPGEGEVFWPFVVDPNVWGETLINIDHFIPACTSRLLPTVQLHTYRRVS